MRMRMWYVLRIVNTEEINNRQLGGEDFFVPLIDILAIWQFGTLIDTWYYYDHIDTA